MIDPCDFDWDRLNDEVRTQYLSVFADAGHLAFFSHIVDEIHTYRVAHKLDMRQIAAVLCDLMGYLAILNAKHDDDPAITEYIDFCEMALQLGAISARGELAGNASNKPVGEQILARKTVASEQEPGSTRRKARLC